MVINVKDLSKIYKTYHKPNGLYGSIKSIFVRKYDEKLAVNNISFSVEEGELVGFIGPNGAGKTTTLKMLSGLLYPTTGNIKVLGYDPWERKYEFLRQISLVMGQKTQLWWNLPVIETFKLIKEIYDIPDKQYKKSLNALVDILNCGDILHSQARQLSLGQRMKAELISVLLHQPKILFLDEPTIGLDVVMQQQIRSFISQYNKEFKSTILLTSHYMDDVKELAKRVIIISNGTLTYDGSLNTLMKKYIKTKEIEIIFSGKSKQNIDISKFGEIKKSTNNNIVIKVKREDVPYVSSQLLSLFKVIDINIKEPNLEDIVRSIFKTQQ